MANQALAAPGKMIYDPFGEQGFAQVPQIALV